MSASITDDLTEDKRNTRMQQLVSFLTSGKPLSSFVEDVEEDLTFAKLKEARDAADNAVDIENPSTRLSANYVGALYRDTKYAHAGRNFMLKQGYHNAFRELYEGGKVAVDNEIEWADE